MSSQSPLGLPPIPSELRSILPFLQRADEVKHQDPIISYWSTYYAAQQGISAQARDASSRHVLSALLDMLERMKKDIGPTDPIDDEAAGCAYVENFALRVFSLADNEDRKGNATRATAKKFLAAANFLEVLRTFSNIPLSDNIEEKIRYAKWKAADIAKAFREGRKPTPGPAASETQTMPDIVPEPAAADEANSMDRKPRSAWVSGELEGQPSPQAMTPPPVPSPRPLSAGFTPPRSPPAHQEVDPQPSTVDHHYVPQFPERPPPDHRHVPQFPEPPPLPPPIPSVPHFFPSPADHQLGRAPPTVPSPSVPITSPPMPSAQVELTPSLVVKVQKHCRYAISALDYEDAEQARKELRTALALLGG